MSTPSDCESIGPISNTMSISRKAHPAIVIPKLPQVAFVNDKYEPEMIINNRVDPRKKEKSHKKN